jgi:DNA-binding MarR family transcriptional regulator
VSWQLETLRLAKNRELTGSDLRVLLCCQGLMDFDNLVTTTVSDIGREIGMTPNNAARAMSKLVALGLVERGPLHGGRRVHRVSPQLGYKGAFQDAVRAKKRMMRQQQPPPPPPPTPTCRWVPLHEGA